MKNKNLNIKNLFLLLFIIISTTVYSQIDSTAQVLKLNETDVELIEIFDALEKHYGVRFSFATNSLLKQKVDVDFQESNLDTILYYLLGEKDMEFKRVSDNVLIRKTKDFSIQDKEYNKKLHIKGKVISNQEELSYATVTIENTSIGTYTDENGLFDIEIPNAYKDNNLIISYVGFTQMKYSIKELKNEFLIIPLSQAQNLVQEINIVNREKPIKISAFSDNIILNNSQLANKTSGVYGSNINRNIQLLPGITAHNDKSSDILIRGSAGDGTLILLDGMPIYKASHYYGIFSTINSSYVDSINVFKNVFPIQYSGKTAGIVEMLGQSNLNVQKQLMVDFNLLTAEVSLKTPVTKKSAFVISGKTTWNKISNENFSTTKSERKDKKNTNSFKDKVDNNSSSPGVDFADIQSKYLWKPNKNTSLNANVFFSREKAENDYSTEVINNNSETIDITITEEKNWMNLGSSIGTIHNLNDRLKYSSNTYYSRFNENEENDISIDLESSQGAGNDEIDLDAEQLNQLIDIGSSHIFAYRIKRNTISLGSELNSKRINYVFEENNDKVFRGTDVVNKISLFGGIKTEIKEKIFIDAALRANYFFNLDELIFSPRILVNYRASDNLNFKASFGNYQQIARQLYFEYRAVPMDIWVSSLSNNIPILRSSNFMLGGTAKFAFFTIDIEGYYKSMDGAIEYAALNPEIASDNSNKSQDYRLFLGDARMYGLDLMLSSGYKNYETFLSYTLSKSQEKYATINNGNYYASERDRRHQFKWVNSYKLNNWMFNLNAIYSSGRPYTNITNTGKNSDITSSSAEDLFTRLPAYQRIDISTTYSLRVRRQSVDLTLSVFNVLNNQNVEYIQSVVTSGIENGESFISVLGGESSLLNRTINVGAKFYFIPF